MAKKVKKGASDASFSMGSLYERISSLKPSSMVIIIAGIVIAIFLLSGSIYSFTSNSAGTVGYTDHFIWFYPDLSGQYLSENIISGALYAIGFVGLFAIYQSTKNAYKPRQAYMLMVIGISLLMVSYIVLEYGAYLKVNHIY
jgi:hypothetical protein